jgi:signal transduction histidine kinase
VRDDGEGIPAEFQEAIFEKFTQARERQLGRKTDTGLGLAFCKLAVEAHGGTIAVFSQVGQGSTFSLTLPIAQKPGD